MDRFMKAQLIDPEDVAYVWEHVAPLLDKVQEHTEGEVESEDFLEPLTHGDMQLWIATEAVSYTHLTLPTNREV